LVEQNEKNITLTVHPYIEAYIKKGFINRQMKWFLKYNQWIKVKSNPAYQITEFHFFSGAEEIKL
jgi:ribonuclease G